MQPILILKQPKDKTFQKVVKNPNIQKSINLTTFLIEWKKNLKPYSYIFSAVSKLKDKFCWKLQMAIFFQYANGNFFLHSQMCIFAISNFAIIEEIASGPLMILWTH